MADFKITLTDRRKPLPDPDTLVFGKTFTAVAVVLYAVFCRENARRQKDVAKYLEKLRGWPSRRSPRSCGRAARTPDSCAPPGGPRRGRRSCPP